MAGDRASGREAGMDDFLSEPFQRKDLVSLLEAWSPKAEAVRQADGSAGGSAPPFPIYRARRSRRVGTARRIRSRSQGDARWADSAPFGGD